MICIHIFCVYISLGLFYYYVVNCLIRVGEIKEITGVKTFEWNLGKTKVAIEEMNVIEAL